MRPERSVECRSTNGTAGRLLARAAVDGLMFMRLTRNVLLIAALAVVALLGCVASTGHASAAAPRAQRFLWGAWIGKQFTGSEPPWNWAAVTAFEARNAGGRPVSIVHWGVGTPWDHDFNDWVNAFNRVRRAHALSLIDMYSRSVPLSSLAGGAYDSALRTWAVEAKQWGHPFLLRFDWEMNGGWFPWGTNARRSSRTTPADYVAAWRHMHDIFAAAGASNVRWVWCPNTDPQQQMTNLASIYPGNAYVDWTCLDGYNRDDPWISFTKLFASTYHRIMRLAPAKPMIVGEVASTGRGGSKAAWIKGMFHALPLRFRNIRGLVWYDKYGLPTDGGATDWPIELSRSASVAFSQGLRRVLAKTCPRGRRRHCR